MFKGSETPTSSILIFPHRNSKSQLFLNEIERDGLKFTESNNPDLNIKIQGITDVFISGLKKRIAATNEWQDEYTLPLLIYTIIRNNVIKYYHDKHLEVSGVESLEELCRVIPNINTNTIAYYVYYYIYETDIALSFVETYKKIRLDIESIRERKKEEKLEEELFGKPKKKLDTRDSISKSISPIERVDRMSGEQFEIFMENYFSQKGYKVERTPLSGDYGVDLIIEHELGGKIGVQLKCYSKKVPADAIQQVSASLQHYKLSSGMVITNNYFQPSAIRLAEDNNITLWDRDKLIEKLGELVQD